MARNDIRPSTAQFRPFSRLLDCCDGRLVARGGRRQEAGSVNCMEELWYNLQILWIASTADKKRTTQHYV